MEDHHNPKPTAQMLWVAGDVAESLPRRAEEHVVDLAFVLQGDVCDLLWQGEDHVKVGDRQKVALPRFQPLGTQCGLALGAVPISARVVGDASVFARIALFDVPAEGSGSTSHEIAEHPTLLRPERQRGQAFALDHVPDDVSDLEGATTLGHREPLQRHLLEWTAHPLKLRAGDMIVDVCRGEAAVPEKVLYDTDADAALEQVRCEAVAQRVRRHAFAYCGPGSLDHALHTARAEVPTCFHARKQPALRSMEFVVGPKNLEEVFRQRHEPVLVSLRLADVEHHAPAIYILGPQAKHF
jgi:hypothetical protein